MYVCTYGRPKWASNLLQQSVMVTAPNSHRAVIIVQKQVVTSCLLFNLTLILYLLVKQIFCELPCMYKVSGTIFFMAYLLCCTSPYCLQVLAVACVFSVGLVLGYGGARRGSQQRLGPSEAFSLRSPSGPCSPLGVWPSWYANDHKERRTRLVDKLVQSISQDQLEGWLWLVRTLPNIRFHSTFC